MSLTEQEKFGVMLFHKRNKLGLRQVDVAKKIHLQPSTISTYECGVVKNITLATRVKLAQALDLSLEEILYNSEKECLKLRIFKGDKE